MDFEIKAYAHEFLLLRYGDTGFFVNRAQFSASTSREELRTISSPLDYFSAFFIYSGENVLLFDFDKYLRNMFKCKQESEATMSLLMSLDDFSPANRSVIRSALARNPKLSQQYLGINITSQAQITEISIDQIYTIQGVLRDVLMRHGILGCRFPVEGEIEYFLDMETAVINVLQRIVE